MQAKKKAPKMGAERYYTEKLFSVKAA